MKIYFDYKTLRVQLAAILLMSGPIVLCGRTQAQQVLNSKPALTKRLVGDYGYWSKYQDPPYSAAQIPYSKLTHINHFGVGFGSEAALSVPDGFLEPSLLRKAHKAGVKVLLGIGGDFTILQASPQLVPQLVDNLWNFASKYGYDGVDIDWEYPTSGQTSTFFDLFVALRTKFPSPDYVLSADVPPWGNSGEGYDIPQVNPYLDYFNIMMYDCAGPWTQDGQLNSEIFWDPADPDPWECQPGGAANEAVTIFEQEGVAPSQLNMGSPFYGYAYATVSELWGECSNASHTSDGNCDWAVSSVNYGTYVKQRINQHGWQSFYDPVALVPYMLRTDGKPGFITYDDESSTYYRVWYSDWEWNLGGTFMWSLDEDYDGHSQDLLDAMYAASLGSAN